VGFSQAGFPAYLSYPARPQQANTTGQKP